MPNYKTHLIGGFFAFAALRLIVQGYCDPSLSVSCEWLLCSLLGSLFPDIDTKSKGQKLFYWLLAPLFFYYILQQNIHSLSIIGVVTFIPLLVNHRGMLHRVWFIALVSLLILFFAFVHAPRCFTIIFFDILFFSCGVLSHIWLDIGLQRMLKYK